MARDWCGGITLLKNDMSGASVDVGSSDEFMDRIFRIVAIDGKEFGVLRWGEAVYVVRNICPHHFSPVCRGLVRESAQSEAPGTIVLQDSPIVICPNHRWEFRLPSGFAVRSRHSIKTYPARIQEGRVLVDFGARARQA